MRPDAMPVVVCGLVAEARIARGRDPLLVIAGGGDRGRIEGALVDAGPVPGIISFGIAGGLSPVLRPGDMRIAHAVVAPDGRSYPTDAGWTAAVSRRLATPLATFAGVDAPVVDVAGKAALHAATGAAVVDMESHLVGAFAARTSLPFVAIRVVADAAGQTLPPAARVGMRRDGSVDLPAILVSLLRTPAQLPALIRTGRDAQKAFAALFRCRELLGPGFALLDL